MKCVKCDKEATYDSPENLCDEHWFEWWTEGYSKEEIESLKKEIKEENKLSHFIS